MSERERNQVTEARHEKLAREIACSPLNNPVREALLLRLKVASSVGYAAVLRDFEAEMERYRVAHLPSYRHRPASCPRAFRSTASLAVAG